MDSRKALFAILAGVALTMAIGILLTPYKDSSGRKKAGDKDPNSADVSEGTINDPVTDNKSKVMKRENGAERRVHERKKWYK